MHRKYPMFGRRDATALQKKKKNTASQSTQRLPRYGPLKIATSEEYLEHPWLFTWHVPRPSPRCIKSSQLWGRRDGTSQQKKKDRMVQSAQPLLRYKPLKALQAGPGRAAHTEVFRFIIILFIYNITRYIDVIYIKIRLALPARS